MSRPQEITGNQETPMGVVATCNNLFRVAKDLQHSTSDLMVNISAHDFNEFIVLSDESQQTVAFLSRVSNPENGVNPFPYILTFDTIGFDLENNEPERVTQAYHIDHSGNFHHILRIDHREVAIDVSPAVTEEWTAFFNEALVNPIGSVSENELY